MCLPPRTAVLTMTVPPEFAQSVDRGDYGPRPFCLIDRMTDGLSKEKLQSCAGHEVLTGLRPRPTTRIAGVSHD